MRRSLIFILASALAALSCSGETNLFDCKHGFKKVKCDAQTKDEQAQADLNNGDYSGAITLYVGLIQSDPTNYARYPLLAAAYAAAGGLQILNAAQASFSGSGSILTAFASLVPAPNVIGAAAYKQNVASIKTAVDTLHGIPVALIASTSATPYAGSADLQLTLYQSAYTIMFLNEFALSPTTGQISTAQLSTMSEADAETVVANLLAVGQLPAASGNAALQAKINQAASAINSEPGATTKDKISAFIASQPGAGTAAAKAASLQ